MDEFLVSGETIVRDLQLGMERAATFGGAMDVGYLPDMFGHVAQMPQLLRLAGIHHAVVWRGVPRAIDRTAFWWEAPDGSTVRAEYLPQGYGNGEGIADDPKALLDRIAEFETDHGRFVRDGDPILWMNGTDHQAPQSWLGRVVAEANELQDDYALAITSLAEHLGDAPTDGLPTWVGELRSGARANLLMGVASNRVDVKQAAARAERALERRAEPLSAVFLPADRWPGTLLDVAWRDVVRNAAHDSICACSVDTVCDAVRHRYAEATDIAEGLAARAVDAVADSMADEGWVVVNPTARTRSGLVELDVPGTGPLDGAQVLVEKDAVVADLDLALDEARPYLENLTSQQLGARTFINAIEVDDGDDGTVDLTLRVAPRLLTNLLVARVMADVLHRLEARAGARLRFRILREPFRRVLVRAADVPGFGWRLLGDVEPARAPVTATATGRGLSNGLLTIEVDRTDGTFAVDGVAGFDRLVDGGDKGDTYNYDPPPDDVVVDTPSSVDVTVVESGPLRGRLRVVRRYAWPDHEADGTRAGATRDVDVTTTLEVRAGERAVRVTTSFVNPARDHRLRAHFPVPGGPAATSVAECAFGIVERGLDAEGGPTERALPTFPSRRFVRAGDLTVVHEGLLEYELVDGGAELALTLLRATGMLSRVDLGYRPLPAGPPIPMEGPQLLGPIEARYAVCVGPAVDPYALVDDVFVPLELRPTKGGGNRTSSGTELAVTGVEVSAVRRVAGGLELRVFNPTPHDTTCAVDGRAGWVVDLRGAPVRPFDGVTTVRPWEIVTLLLA
jgi:hypothetical protein